MERTTILATPRLRLTTWRPEDVDELFAVHSDPETMRYVRHSRPESRAGCAELIEQYIAEQTTGWTKWRLTDSAGEMIGRAGFGSHRRSRELGYTIRRDRWGQGLATEVGAALVALFRADRTDAQPLWAHVAVGNPASARVVGKLGFVAEGQEVVADMLCDVFRLPDGEA